MPDRIIVVDNDPDKSAEPVVLSFINKLPVIYISEQKQGTPCARNAAIGICKTALLGFVDDDCTLDPHWTTSGLNALRNKKITYTIGKSLLYNTKNLIALTQHIHYSYWLSRKLKQSFPFSPPMKFDTKNVIIRTNALRKYRLIFNKHYTINTVDSSDTDMGFRLDRKNRKGIFVPQMIVAHEESENLCRFLYKSYHRGRLAYRLAQQWDLWDELVCLPHKNWLTYIKSIRYWPKEYAEYMTENRQPPIIKITIFLLIKVLERAYLEGYLHEMSISEK